MTALQQFLATAYEDFPSPTGYFGPVTEAAVKQWQGEHGIERIGIVGPRTLAAMGLCTAAQWQEARKTDAAPPQQADTPPGGSGIADSTGSPLAELIRKLLEQIKDLQQQILDMKNG